MAQSIGQIVSYQILPKPILLFVCLPPLVAIYNWAMSSPDTSHYCSSNNSHFLPGPGVPCRAGLPRASGPEYESRLGRRQRPAGRRGARKLPAANTAGPGAAVWPRPVPPVPGAVGERDAG